MLGTRMAMPIGQSHEYLWKVLKERGSVAAVFGKVIVAFYQKMKVFFNFLLRKRWQRW